MRTPAVLAVLASAALLVPGTAQAATRAGSISYESEQVASFSFPDRITLPAHGCARLRIKYSVDRSIVYPRSYVAFSLTSKSTTSSAMEYVQPGNGTTLPGTDPWQGTEEIVLCSTAQPFVDSYGETKMAPAFQRGSYELVAFLNVIEPVQATVATKGTRLIVA